jgi:MYXO-CTERM domain-containing protein
LISLRTTGTVLGQIYRSRFNSLAFALFVLALTKTIPAFAQETIDVGETGFDVKRPVLASACPNGCPWGELGDFVKKAMEPMGYEVILCRNCNRDLGPRVVSEASIPPEITVVDIAVGTTQRVNAPVDFGVTESSFLDAAYEGREGYAQQGPYSNLRLIAKIEDPYFLLVAVKAESTITDLAQIADEQMPVRILSGGSSAQAVLDYYGLTSEAVESWGGSFGNPMVEGVLYVADIEFDVIISDLATPSNNPESSYWPTLSQAYDLRFLDLPETLLDELAADEKSGLIRVVARWGFLRGVDREIQTVARSGEAVFCRDDTPDDAAYDVAKAIDEHRGALKWFIRPYSYDSRTVWKNFDVPLHPGAERYYREVGYMPESGSDTDAGMPRESDRDDASVCAQCEDNECNGCGCRVTRNDEERPLALLLLAAAFILLSARRRRMI